LKACFRHLSNGAPGYFCFSESCFPHLSGSGARAEDKGSGAEDQPSARAEDKGSGAEDIPLDEMKIYTIMCSLQGLYLNRYVNM